jgi:hypothetical protein
MQQKAQRLAHVRLVVGNQDLGAVVGGGHGWAGSKGRADGMLAVK